MTDALNLTIEFLLRRYSFISAAVTFARSRAFTAVVWRFAPARCANTSRCVRAESAAIAVTPTALMRMKKKKKRRRETTKVKEMTTR